MTGVSVAGLAETLVRVQVGHLVSSSSMVSRAYLVDDCVGVVVDDGGLWLVSTLPALAPDPESLRVRAYEKGGIPVEHGNPRLTKITVAWGESSVDINAPTVAEGSRGAAAVSLAVPASLGERIRSGDGPRPVALGHDPELSLGDELAVVLHSEAGPVVRWARVSSDPGFSDLGLALNVGLPAESAGSPVFRLDGAPEFCGIASPLDASTSVLLPTSAMSEAIPAT